MDRVRLTCVRHGETIHNIEGRVQGWQGSELTKLGHKQAEDFAENYKEIPQAIFYSDLNRVKQTVDALIAKFPDVPSFPDWRLRERSFGTLENRKSKDIDWDSFWNLDSAKSHHDAEPEAHLRERVKSFLRDVELTGVSYAVVVSHGGVLNKIKHILEPKSDETHVQYAHADSFDIEYSFDNPNLYPKPAPKWSYK